MNLLNKKGEGYVYPCVMIVIICFILSVLICFICTVSMIRNIKENCKSVFDSYITKQSIEVYNSVKQGNDDISYLDQEEFLTDFCRFCTLESKSGLLYNYDSERNLNYYMTTPYISFVEASSLKMKVTFTLYVPIRFNGAWITTAVIPVEIKSSFMERY